MKLKILPPLFLSITLPIAASFAQAPIESRIPQNNGYGIEPEQSYSGGLVLELLQAAETEIDAAVNKAYSEGYKAGLLASRPDAEYYRTLSENLRGELEAERKRNNPWKGKLLSGLTGFAIGAAGMSAVHLFRR